MCRIASLFSSQTPEGSMPGDAHPFSHIEKRSPIKDFSFQEKNQRKFTPFWQNALQEHAPPCVTAKNWMAQFKRSDLPHKFSTSSWTTQNSDKPGDYWSIHNLILEEHLLSAKSIPEHLGISRDRVGFIIHEHLDTRKLFLTWVLKCLNGDQNRQRWQSSRQIWNFFWHDPKDFLSRSVTIDETCLCHYDPETKRRSLEWRHSDSPRPKTSG